MTDFSLIRRVFLTAAAIGLALTVANPAPAAEKYLTVASTTSTQNSGLFGHILPKFTAKTGIQVRVIAVGTGKAIRMARDGDADVLLVHHRPSEEKFVAEGFGVKRFPLMANDFVIVGPQSDPAAIKGMKDAPKALAKLAGGQIPFVSRGDDSGTHKREKSLWKAAGVDAAKASGSWYREIGSGMGATLNTAAAMNAYTLSDRGTWLSFKNRGSLTVAVEGDDRLLNPYGVILVNKKRHPHVKAAMGQALIDWLVSYEGQSAIGSFRVGGEVLFHPAHKSGS